MQRVFVVVSLISFAVVGGWQMFWPPAVWAWAIVGPLFLIGVRDCLQKRHAIQRAFPVIGHARYLLEKIRPEIRQYLFESNTEELPFSRDRRSMVYQRAKGVRDTVPFGTQQNTYQPGYEWLNHSLAPQPPSADPPRVRIGGERCSQPYDAALLNVSAMSYGSLSKNAVRALNIGAHRGGFAHNTGEGGVSPHHLAGGGDLIWQIGTAYFGCRTADGQFSPSKFQGIATLPEVKMIEIKLSQGAKPGHGGLLPADKVDAEVAEIRGIPRGVDCVSPPAHATFTTPRELIRFIAELRHLSAGKPVGIKLCLGSRTEFMSICKAMIEEDDGPDFISVDGGEGGTGAAPQEFTNSLGTPLNDGLTYVHNALLGLGLRDRVRLLASGKIASGFDMARMFALGADVCYAARSMLFAIGCIQALKCNTNHCPVGVCTQNPGLVKALVVTDKSERVYQYQARTVRSLLKLISAAGFENPAELRPWHIYRRVSHTEVMHFGQIYPQLEAGELLDGEPHEGYGRPWFQADADSFSRVSRRSAVPTQALVGAAT